MREIKLIIFDLDGTLYEDTTHFEFFAQLLMNKLPKNIQKDFLLEYKKMKDNEHIVSIGKAYDAKEDSVLTIDPFTFKVINAFSWEGKRWDVSKVKATYPGPLTFNFDHLIAIGDGWWLPVVTAFHFGLTDTKDSYIKTKEYMTSDQFKLVQTPGLKEALIKLSKNKHLILVTNSEEDDVNRLLTKLDLQNIFDDIFPSANKPANSREHFQYIKTKYEINPKHILSIGDNFINDIAPAIQLDMHGLYIQTGHTKPDELNNLHVVPNLINLF